MRISPFLWFDTEAEEAARYYVSIFKNSRMISVAHYPEAGSEIHGRAPGSVMTVEFELDGQRFVALNGGPLFKFNESVSFVVDCDTQEEVDYYWDRLSSDGNPKAQACGWLKDKYGLSWQIVPSAIPRMMTDPDRRRTERVMAAVMQMKKLDVATLERAYAGE